MLFHNHKIKLKIPVIFSLTNLLVIFVVFNSESLQDLLSKKSTSSSSSIGSSIFKNGSQIKNITSKNLQPLLPRVMPMTMPKIDPTFLSEKFLAQIKLYVNFIGNYSEEMRWIVSKGISILFPQNFKEYEQFCTYMKIELLKIFSIHSNCFKIEENGNNGQSLNLTKDSKSENVNILKSKSPRVSLLFSSYSQNGLVPHDFLINYKKRRPLLVISDTENTTIENFIPEISTNYKWTLAIFNTTQNTASIYDIYGFSLDSNALKSYFGVWTPLKGLNILPIERRGLSNFHQKLLKITSVVGRPVVYLDRIPGQKNPIGRGYLPDIINAISEHLNFSYILVEPPDKAFGAVDKNGNWTGMVGLLQRKEAEMAMMSFSLTLSRKLVIDFSPPVEYSATRLLIRRDFQNTELKWNVFLEPFHWSVWIAIPAIIFLGVFSIFTFTFFDLMNMYPIESAWVLLCTFLQKGIDDHSLFIKLPCRLVLGSFWLLAVVIYTCYTARLTSFLAATTETLPFKSLFDAVQSSQWKIGLVRGSSYQDRVRESSAPEMQAFSRKLAQGSDGVLVSGFDEGVNRVYSEKYIFFTSDLVPSFMIKDNCSYTWLPGKFFPGFGYMGYQKNLPYDTAISNRVSRIRESGQMRRLFRKWWGDESSCSISDIAGGDVFKGMGLYETGSAFFVLLTGTALGVLFLSIEIFTENIFSSKLEDADTELHHTVISENLQKFKNFLSRYNFYRSSEITTMPSSSRSVLR